jgi:hypothetical protein
MMLQIDPDLQEAGFARTNLQKIGDFLAQCP